MKLFDQWQYGKQQHATESLQSRIEPLKEVILKVEKQLTKEKQRLEHEKRDIDQEKEDSVMLLLSEKRRLCRELRTVRQSIRDEESGERQLVADIAACWMNLKECRKATRMKRTDLELKMKQERFDAQAEEIHFNARVDAEASEEQTLFDVEQDYKIHKCEVEIAQKEAEMMEEKAKVTLANQKMNRAPSTRLNALGAIGASDDIPFDLGAGATGATAVLVLQEELDEKRKRLTSLQSKRQRGHSP